MSSLDAILADSNTDDTTNDDICLKDILNDSKINTNQGLRLIKTPIYNAANKVTGYDIKFRIDIPSGSSNEATNLVAGSTSASSLAFATATPPPPTPTPVTATNNTNPIAIFGYVHHVQCDICGDWHEVTSRWLSPTFECKNVYQNCL